jgi:hypothetical protein
MGTDVGTLFEPMVLPLARMAVAGFTWYQGEANECPRNEPVQLNWPCGGTYGYYLLMDTTYLWILPTYGYYLLMDTTLWILPTYGYYLLMDTTYLWILPTYGYYLLMDTTYLWILPTYGYYLLMDTTLWILPYGYYLLMDTHTPLVHPLIHHSYATHTLLIRHSYTTQVPTTPAPYAA